MKSPLPTEIPAPVAVLGLPIRPLTTDGLIGLMHRRAKAGVRTTACYANAHTVNLAFQDPFFARLLAGSDVLYADGKSVVWASRWSDQRLPERMTAADYFPRFAAQCASSNLSLFLLGGREGVARRAAEKLKKQSPTLRILGTHHGYFSPSQSDEVVRAINSSGADVVVVGLSSPRQERWLHQNGDALQVPIRWCVGALFDYMSGMEPRAPRWLCKLGCEWAYRLWVDPVGKWRRYLLGNPRFIWNLFRWQFGGGLVLLDSDEIPGKGSMGACRSLTVRH